MFRHDNVFLYNIYLTRNLDNLSLFCSALCMTQKYLFEKFQLLKMWRKKMNNSCICIYRMCYTWSLSASKCWIHRNVMLFWFLYCLHLVCFSWRRGWSHFILCIVYIFFFTFYKIVSLLSSFSPHCCFVLHFHHLFANINFRMRCLK